MINETDDINFLHYMLTNTHKIDFFFNQFKFFNSFDFILFLSAHSLTVVVNISREKIWIKAKCSRNRIWREAWTFIELYLHTIALWEQMLLALHVHVWLRTNINPFSYMKDFFFLQQKSKRKINNNISKDCPKKYENRLHHATL